MSNNLLIQQHQRFDTSKTQILEGVYFPVYGVGASPEVNLEVFAGSDLAELLAKGLSIGNTGIRGHGAVLDLILKENKISLASINIKSGQPSYELEETPIVCVPSTARSGNLELYFLYAYYNVNSVDSLIDIFVNILDKQFSSPTFKNYLQCNTQSGKDLAFANIPTHIVSQGIYTQQMHDAAVGNGRYWANSGSLTNEFLGADLTVAKKFFVYLFSTYNSMVTAIGSGSYIPGLDLTKLSNKSIVVLFDNSTLGSYQSFDINKLGIYFKINNEYIYLSSYKRFIKCVDSAEADYTTLANEELNKVTALLEYPLNLQEIEAKLTTASDKGVAVASSFTLSSPVLSTTSHILPISSGLYKLLHGNLMHKSLTDLAKGIGLTRTLGRVRGLSGLSQGDKIKVILDHLLRSIPTIIKAVVVDHQMVKMLDTLDMIPAVDQGSWESDITSKHAGHFADYRMYATTAMYELATHTWKLCNTTGTSNQTCIMPIDYAKSPIEDMATSEITFEDLRNIVYDLVLIGLIGVKSVMISDNVQKDVEALLPNKQPAYVTAIIAELKNQSFRGLFSSRTYADEFIIAVIRQFLTKIKVQSKISMPNSHSAALMIGGPFIPLTTKI